MSGYTFKQDLAKAYFGDRCKEIARRELARAIHTNARLMDELLAADYDKSQKRLTPRQVQIIYKYLGEP